MELSITIDEVDAARQVTGEVYDDMGNVVGHRSDAEVFEEMRSLAGKVRYHASFTVNGKRMGIQSAVILPSEREYALRSIMDSAALSISRHWETLQNG